MPVAKSRFTSLKYLDIPSAVSIGNIPHPKKRRSVRKLLMNLKRKHWKRTLCRKVIIRKKLSRINTSRYFEKTFIKYGPVICHLLCDIPPVFLPNVSIVFKKYTFDSGTAVQEYSNLYHLKSHWIKKNHIVPN